MRSQPRRPAFVWFVVLLCGVYAEIFAFTAYVSARTSETRRVKADPDRQNGVTQDLLARFVCVLDRCGAES